MDLRLCRNVIAAVTFSSTLIKFITIQMKYIFCRWLLHFAVLKPYRAQSMLVLMLLLKITYDKLQINYRYRKMMYSKKNVGTFFVIHFGLLIIL